MRLFPPVIDAQNAVAGVPFLRQPLPLTLAAFCLINMGHAQGTLPTTSFAVLTREHVDLSVLYDGTKSPPLELIVWQRELALDLPTNQVIFVAKEQARLTLPAGTPFGDAGQPMWILPQSQNPNLLYMGVNVERVPPGVFTGPVTIRLTGLAGPGYFMAWQATAPGEFNIRINTRDGLSEEDAFTPLIGAHEHFNWGFSTTGVYCATFQASGRRVGDATNVSSAESTFVFHVQPLPPATNFGIWQKTHWPPGFTNTISGKQADPDADGIINALEYAFGTQPLQGDVGALPELSFVEDAGHRFGALSFNHFLPAGDVIYRPESTSDLSGQWLGLSDVVGTVPLTNHSERITVRDVFPVTRAQRRFYRVPVELLPSP